MISIKTYLTDAEKVSNFFTTKKSESKLYNPFQGDILAGEPGFEPGLTESESAYFI